MYMYRSLLWCAVCSANFNIIFISSEILQIMVFAIERKTCFSFPFVQLKVLLTLMMQYIMPWLNLLQKINIQQIFEIFFHNFQLITLISLVVLCATIVSSYPYGFYNSFSGDFGKFLSFKIRSLISTKWKKHKHHVKS